MRFLSDPIACDLSSTFPRTSLEHSPRRLQFPAWSRSLSVIMGLVLADFLVRHAVATLVLIGVFVEVRHFRTGPAAGDDLDELVTSQRRLVQVGRLSRRTRIAVPIAVDAMAELAIRLVVEQPLPE